jgi:hypothetical protein
MSILSVFLPISFWNPEPLSMKLESISMVYFINASNQSVSVCVADNGSVKMSPL